MKKLLILILLLPILGCSNIIKNKQKSSDFNCPQVFFATEDRVFIDNSNSLDDVLIRAELNNFAINKECQQKNEIVNIPLDVLIIAQPLNNLQNSEFEIPVYISILDQYDNILETQYFLISISIAKNNKTNTYVETDITKRLEIITRQLKAFQIVIGFMLEDKKRKLIN